MEEKGAVDANVTYHDERISTLELCRLRRPHRYEDLLPNVHDVEFGIFQHAKGSVCFPANDNAGVGKERDNLL